MKLLWVQHNRLKKVKRQEVAPCGACLKPIITNGARSHAEARWSLLQWGEGVGAGLRQSKTMADVSSAGNPEGPKSRWTAAIGGREGLYFHFFFK